MKQYDKNSLIGFVLMALILIVFNTFFFPDPTEIKPTPSTEKESNKNISIENFKSDGIEWGYNPEKQYHNFDSSLTRPIVGPDASSDVMNHWQYNPENTQVDYKYYQQSNDVRYESTRDNLNIDSAEDNLVQKFRTIYFNKI